MSKSSKCGPQAFEWQGDPSGRAGSPKRGLVCQAVLTLGAGGTALKVAVCCGHFNLRICRHNWTPNPGGLAQVPATL